MTAPVEVTYANPSDNSETKVPQETAMAFLYRSTEQGEPGRHEQIQVVDVPPLLAVSLGCRGEMTPASVAAARRLLVSSLAEYADQFAVDGDLRLLGYNSPFVPEEKRYFEVQLPVARLDSAPAR